MEFEIESKPKWTEIFKDGFFWIFISVCIIVIFAAIEGQEKEIKGDEMSTETKRQPHMSFPPGVIILDEMEDCDWSFDDIVNASGIDWMILYRVIYMVDPITHEIAAGLEKAFGTSQEYWLALESNFREWIEHKEKECEPKEEPS